MKLATQVEKIVVGLVTTLVIAALATSVYVNGLPSLRSDNVILIGHTPDVVYRAQLLGSAAPQKKMDIVVGLKLRNQQALDTLLAAQSDSHSPQFRHFLTPAQFLQQFGPTQSDVDTALKYFTSQGLTIVRVSSNNMLIELEGTNSQVEKAFDVHMNMYNLQGMTGFTNGVYMSNSQDPALPARVADVVQSVSGLSDFSQFHSRMLKSDKKNKNPNVPMGYTPQDIAQAYEYPNSNNVGALHQYSGKNHTVAIASVYSYLQSDVDTFWKQFGVKRTGTVSNIAIGGTTKRIEGETTLDLETVGAQAPGADIRMYLGANPALRTFTLIFNQIVVDDASDVVSVSWGICEQATGTAQMQTESAIFKQAAAQGIAVFSSSGDDGAYDCGEKKHGKYAVDYPSSDPNVTSVGGTQLWFADGWRLLETAWSKAGGGFSTYFVRPSWQVVPGLPSGTMRATADVSMDADPNTGYAILDEGDWIQIGGTSVSTPDWAGLWILAVDAAGQRLGPANPTLYRIANSPEYANVFTDVTTGDNGRSIGPGYSAGKGWDNPTGWGVPHGGALVDWLLADARAGNSSSPTNGQSTNKSPVPPQVITPNLPGAQAKPL